VLACASEIHERLTGAAVLSGCGPLDTRAARRGASDLDRPLLTLSTRAPIAANLLLNSVLAIARRAPRLAVIRMELEMSPRDREVFRRISPSATVAVEFFLEAFRSGTAGVVDDYRVLASPWQFAPEGIEMPVHFWHGDADRLVALEQAQSVAARIPNAEFIVLPGEGHMLLVEHFDDVLLALAP